MACVHWRKNGASPSSHTQRTCNVSVHLKYLICSDSGVTDRRRLDDLASVAMEGKQVCLIFLSKEEFAATFLSEHEAHQFYLEIDRVLKLMKPTQRDSKHAKATCDPQGRSRSERVASDDFASVSCLNSLPASNDLSKNIAHKYDPKSGRMLQYVLPPRQKQGAKKSGHSEGQGHYTRQVKKMINAAQKQYVRKRGELWQQEDRIRV